MGDGNNIIERPLYIGEWIKALGMKQVDVARAAGIGKSYLNLICSRKRKNPAYQIILKIADAMDMSVLDLQTPPPDNEFIEKSKNISPRAMIRLQRVRKTG